MKQYKGSILGFNYDIVLASDAEFETWLTAKLNKYVFPDTTTNQVILNVLGKKLGIDKLEQDIAAIKAFLKM